MNFGYLNFGTKDAILGIAFFLVLILTVSFHWSALEFVLSSGVVGMAFFAGNMKQDKRITEIQIKKVKRNKCSDAATKPKTTTD